MRVDIWSDISCPWCFVGKARFDAALAAFPNRAAVEVVHRSFELNPRLDRTLPTASAAHAEKYGMTVAQARAAEEHLAALAEEEGLGYLVEFRDHGNTFDLHRLLHLAADRGLRDELLALFYEANFASERSVYDSEYQAELAVRAGLEDAEVRAVLADTSAYSAQVRADEDEAARLGISGVPFVVIDGRYGVSGAQSAEVFAEALRRGWGDRAPVLTVVEADDQVGCDAEGACAVPRAAHEGGATRA